MAREFGLKINIGLIKYKSNMEERRMTDIYIQLYVPTLWTV